MKVQGFMCLRRATVIGQGNSHALLSNLKPTGFEQIEIKKCSAVPFSEKRSMKMPRDGYILTQLDFSEFDKLMAQSHLRFISHELLCKRFSPCNLENWEITHY